MKMKNLLIVLFLLSATSSFGQGPVKKQKKSTNGNAKSNTTIIVNDLASPSDSIQIINGRKVYVDKNGVQSLEQVK